MSLFLAIERLFIFNTLPALCQSLKCIPTAPVANTSLCHRRGEMRLCGTGGARDRLFIYFFCPRRRRPCWSFFKFYFFYLCCRKTIQNCPPRHFWLFLFCSIINKTNVHRRGASGTGNSRGARRGRESNVIIMEAEHMDFQVMKNAVHPLQCSSSKRKEASVPPQIFAGQLRSSVDENMGAYCLIRHDSVSVQSSQTSAEGRILGCEWRSLSTGCTIVTHSRFGGCWSSKFFFLFFFCTNNLRIYLFIFSHSCFCWRSWEVSHP